MKNSIYLLAFLFCLNAICQQKSLELTNIKNGKIKVINENQRIKIRTFNHKKWVGILKIQDSVTFLVGNQTIKIDSLQSIKNQPKLVGTLKKIILYSGVAIVGASLVKAIQGDESAFNLIAIGAGTTVSAGFIEGLNTNYISRKWRYKIIEK